MRIDRDGWMERGVSAGEGERRLKDGVFDMAASDFMHLRENLESVVRCKHKICMPPAVV